MLSVWLNGQVQLGFHSKIELKLDLRKKLRPDDKNILESVFYFNPCVAAAAAQSCVAWSKLGMSFYDLIMALQAINSHPRVEVGRY